MVARFKFAYYIASAVVKPRSSAVQPAFHARINAMLTAVVAISTEADSHRAPFRGGGRFRETLRPVPVRQVNVQALAGIDRLVPPASERQPSK